MLLFYYIVIILSIIGYGTIFNQKIINYRTNNLGHIGLLGVFSLILISYITTQFLAHSKAFNLSILILGNVLFFNYFFKKKYSTKDIKILFLTASIMFISILIYKNHDDFPYYHFPYILMLSENIHPIGIGKLNIGFNTHSSIFLLGSLFHLPGSNFNLFHLPVAYFMLFSNVFLLSFIFQQILKKEKLFFLFFAISSFIFINIFFYRLAEHGTDRSAMILIIILLIHILIIINRDYETDDLNQIKFLLILLSIIISLKALYILYVIFLLPIFFKIYNKKIFFDVIISNSFFLSLLLFVFVIVTNIFNSGCLLFPEAKTCIQNISWGMSLDKVEEYRIHYENWAKAGAGAGYTNTDKINYIKDFYWFSNWVDKYFFNKVSDLLFSLAFIIIILFLTFKEKKEKNEIKIKFKFLYFLTVFLFLIWFFNYPALRYGGYNLFFILFFLPFSIFIQKYLSYKNNFTKKVIFILILTSLIFFGRNINRLIDENKKYSYNPFKNTEYRLNDSMFRYQNIFEKIKKDEQNKITEIYNNRYILIK